MVVVSGRRPVTSEYLRVEITASLQSETNDSLREGTSLTVAAAAAPIPPLSSPMLSMPLSSPSPLPWRGRRYGTRRIWAPKSLRRPPLPLHPLSGAA